MTARSPWYRTRRRTRHAHPSPAKSSFAALDAAATAPVQTPLERSAAPTRPVRQFLIIKPWHAAVPVLPLDSQHGRDRQPVHLLFPFLACHDFVSILCASGTTAHVTVRPQKEAEPSFMSLSAEEDSRIRPLTSSPFTAFGKPIDSGKALAAMILPKRPKWRDCAVRIPDSKPADGCRISPAASLRPRT